LACLGIPGLAMTNYQEDNLGTRGVSNNLHSLEYGNKWGE